MTVISGLIILVGLVGIVVPVLPGLLLVWAGVLVWAVALRTPGAWVVLAVATLAAIAGTVLKYLFPGRRMRDSGVPWTTLGSGVILALIGLAVIPVVGVMLGFVLGIYLAERVRLGGHAAAWPSTTSALQAVGWSIVIELTAGALITFAWLIGVIGAF